ncbi:MAG TPA: hypothetical protein VF529_06830 [Solirubrobacteraceae bacterium]
MSRIHADTYESVKQVAGSTGRAPAELLRDAWEEYLVRHRDEFAERLELSARMLRSGDTIELAKTLAPGDPARAAKAAARIREAQ